MHLRYAWRIIFRYLSHGRHKKIKICCTTYKNICICQKKAVPLQHENKVNSKYHTCSNSMGIT